MKLSPRGVERDTLFALRREAATCAAAGEGTEQLVELGTVIELDRQREWLKREMGE